MSLSRLSPRSQRKLQRGFALLPAARGAAKPRVAGQSRPLAFKLIFLQMVEPLLSGIVLGLIPVTLSGLFVTAYLQYRRGDQMNF